MYQTMHQNLFNDCFDRRPSHVEYDHLNCQVPNLHSSCIVSKYCFNIVLQKTFPAFTFLSQPHFRGLRLVVLFWGGTARGAGVTAIAQGIGVLVFCRVDIKMVHLVPATSFAGGRLFEFVCLLEMKDVIFLEPLLCLFVDKIFIVLRNSWLWTCFRCPAHCLHPLNGIQVLMCEVP